MEGGRKGWRENSGSHTDHTDDDLQLFEAARHAVLVQLAHLSRPEHRRRVLQEREVKQVEVRVDELEEARLRDEADTWRVQST